MASKFSRICTVCGKEYEYCPNCSKYDHMERWHDAYCSANCKKLYSVCAGYINEWLPKEVEAARLQELDLSYVEKLPQWMQETIAAMKKVDTANAPAINDALAVDMKADEKTDEKVAEVVEAETDHIDINAVFEAKKDVTPEATKADEKKYNDYKKNSYQQKNKSRKDYSK